MRFERMGTWATMLVLLAGLGAWAPVSAADRPSAGAVRDIAEAPLDVALTVHRVVKDAQGKDALVDANDARPGDLLEYRAVYTNRATRALNEVQATLPLPLETVYQPRTASPMGATASTGAEYAAEPLARKVRGADGKETVAPVPYAQYRSLRWRIASIDAGRSVTVSARVRVASGAPLPGTAGAAGSAGTAAPTQLAAR